MRVRILLTDGPQVEDLFWLEHDGSDVYFGVPGTQGKYSAYASGQIHMKHGSTTTILGQSTPLKNLRGYRHLQTVGFPRQLFARRAYGGGKSDTVMWVDVRSVPADVHPNLFIGLVEPGNGQALAEIMKPWGDQASSLVPQQLLLNTSVEPWVYVALAWAR